MANIKSAKKRVKVSATKAMRNKMLKSALKTSLKKYEAAIAAGDAALAQSLYKDTVKTIDQAVSHGIIHSNNAARKKSRFTRMLNSLNG
ncbi:MAG: 30S ribosomal protein S20 [Clostridiales bacterium]|nr:30S ribosomal protein S20 [Clostridiales bacterium]